MNQDSIYISGVILIILCTLPVVYFICLITAAKLLKNSFGSKSKIELMKWRLKFRINNTNYLLISIWIFAVFCGTIFITVGK